MRVLEEASDSQHRFGQKAQKQGHNREEQTTPTREYIVCISYTISTQNIYSFSDFSRIEMPKTPTRIILNVSFIKLNSIPFVRVITSREFCQRSGTANRRVVRPKIGVHNESAVENETAVVNGLKFSNYL